ncbi:uncharacterized protein LOC132744334 [Ruditapes philippinarum]|uniref:uncharacterized protein LOC132744334 n=1 Tax=Ruditapes philippinarum TaxID=129788 RepID=UPI00295AC161|nr:uncharacterized protein LOC132744334 [Ruditapes philippinarum]
MHVVCFVFDHNKIKGLAVKIKEDTSAIMKFLSKEGIPFVVILTKCDVNNEAVKLIKFRAFSDREIKNSMDLAMKTFSIKQSIIFPVINYCHEREVNLEGDALLFAAFNEIVNRGLDYLDDNTSDEEEGIERKPENSVKD